MSTKSKRRKAVRAWMHKESSRLTKEITQKLRSDVVRDMMQYLPHERESIHREDGKLETTIIVPQFPDYRSSPRFVVPMIEVGPFDRYPGEIRSSRRYTPLQFKPVRMRARMASPWGSSNIEWVNWELDFPKDNVEVTRALVHGRGRLSIAANFIERAIRTMQSYAPYGAPLVQDPDLSRAQHLVTEVSEELRRALGDYAPFTEEDERRVEAMRHYYGLDVPR